MARSQAKSRTLRLSLLIGGAIIAVFVIVAVAGRFFLDSDDEPDVVNDVVPIENTVDDTTDDTTVESTDEG